jgi:tripartite-type tricarboxylate transporter receptor subunit TctC
MKNTKIGPLLLIAMLSGLTPARAFSQGHFYEGKTVTMVVTTAPGGSGDLRRKAVVPFLRKYIPGNPSIVMEYMDGGGGRKGANHIYHSARPDGLTIGAASGGIVGFGIMREQGVTYDVDKFIYLGTPENENHAVIYTRRDLGLDSLEKLKARPGIRIGGQTVGHTSYVAGRLFAYFLDLKEPKFIVGYTSPEVDVALMNGELDARANAAVSVLRRNPEWLEKRVMNFHAIMEIPKGLKHPRLAHLPEIESFARNEREKNVLALWRALRGVGSPFILPPGTPKDRVEILQEAMRKTFQDPEFPKYFRKLVDDDPSPLGAAELTRTVREMPRDAEVLDLVKKFSGPGPLPPR